MKSFILTLISLLSISSFASVDCMNIYDHEGHILLKANAQECHNVKWYWKDSNGSYRQFYLNDVENEDASLLLAPPDNIEIIELDQIKLKTEHVEENTIFDLISLNELAQRSWKDLDFCHKISGRTLIDGVLYGSSFDSGNFLWGYAAAKLGTPLVTALLGAHYNSLTNSKYPEEMARQLDSAADQKAIKAGHNYFFKTASKRQLALNYLDQIIP